MSNIVYLSKNESLVKIDVAAQTVTEIEMNDSLSTMEMEKAAKHYKLNPHIPSVLHEVIAAYIREGFTIQSFGEYANSSPRDLLVG